MIPTNRKVHDPVVEVAAEQLSDEDSDLRTRSASSYDVEGNESHDRSSVCTSGSKLIELVPFGVWKLQEYGVSDVDTNAKSEKDALEEQDGEQVGPPNNVENWENSLGPGFAILRHTGAGDSDQGFDAVADARLGFGNRHGIGQLAIEQPVLLSEGDSIQCKKRTHVSSPKKTIIKTTIRL